MTNPPAEVGSEFAQAAPETFQDLPSGDEIAAELEKFLREEGYRD